MHAECVSSVMCVECLHSLAADKVPGHSRSTLIVCPDAILRQWLSEVERHVAGDRLKVFHYKGHTATTGANSVESALSLLINSHSSIASHPLCAHAQTDTCMKHCMW